MVIRCERCSTLYELDEALLSPSGSQVQCTRCHHVFTAFPSRAPGRTLVGVPATRQEDAPALAPERPGPTAGARVAAAAGGAAAVAPARPDQPRPVRAGPPPVYRPSAAAVAPSAVRAPLLRRDTVGTFEARLRWSARWRWLAPLLVVLVAVAGAGAWLLLGRTADSSPARTRSAAMALVALDDVGSLDEGLARLDALLSRSPKHAGVTADRALAQVLRAAALVDDGEGIATRAAARAAERERLRREQPEGWEDAERTAAAELQRLEPEVRAREERARALGASALQALRPLQSRGGDSPEVARGLAAYYALGGERDRARKTVRAARERAPADPWLDLAEAWADARDPDRAARERALVQLGALAAAHPEMLRARYLLARTAAGLGRRTEALSTLDALLAANGRHEAGKRLRDELLAPPPLPAPSPPPVVPVKAPAPRRKIVAQPPASAASVPDPGMPGEGAASAAEPAAAGPGPVEPAPAAAPAEGGATTAAGAPPAPAGADAAAPPPPPKPRSVEPTRGSVTGPPEDASGN